MNKLLLVVISSSILAITACAHRTVSTPEVFEADQGKGMVYIGYRVTQWGNDFNTYNVNWAQGQNNAERVCRNWGYIGAQTLNDFTRSIRRDGMVYYYREYQCIKKSEN